jgi:hypothetical protein
MLGVKHLQSNPRKESMVCLGMVLGLSATNSFYPGRSHGSASPWLKVAHAKYYKSTASDHHLYVSMISYVRQ